MSDIDRVTRILERHLSPIHARSVLLQALRENRVQSTTFRVGDLPTISRALQRGIRLFASDQVSARAMSEVQELCGNKDPVIEPRTVEINSEMDISHARNAARQMCEQLDVSGFSLQKVTTIVSELARNIVSYTSGGTVALICSLSPPRRITIRAVDNGPGITDVSLVLSGAYKSRTGLGRGLIGTRQLADSFDIDTSRAGTRVVAEVHL